MPDPFDPATLAARFATPQIRAVALLGSFARGEAGPYSDVDLLRIRAREAEPKTQTLPDDGSHLIAGRLVTVSSVDLMKAERWFTDPAEATSAIAPLRSARPLHDPEGLLGVLLERANAFRWSEALKHRADETASRQLVGWVEEVFKGLGGLEQRDRGRLLNARFGLSWGLYRVMCVHKGVLVESDNSLFAQVEEAVGRTSRWTGLGRRAFGETAISLHEQVASGLRLYRETARLLDGVLRERDRPLIGHAVTAITRALPEEGQPP